MSATFILSTTFRRNVHISISASWFGELSAKRLGRRHQVGPILHHIRSTQMLNVDFDSTLRALSRDQLYYECLALLSFFFTFRPLLLCDWHNFHISIAWQYATNTVKWWRPAWSRDFQLPCDTHDTRIFYIDQTRLRSETRRNFVLFCWNLTSILKRWNYRIRR